MALNLLDKHPAHLYVCKMKKGTGQFPFTTTKRIKFTAKGQEVSQTNTVQTFEIDAQLSTVSVVIFLNKMER